MNQPLSTKNSQRFTDLFLKVEASCDINAIAIDGVQLWPLIRARLRKPFKVVSKDVATLTPPLLVNPVQDAGLVCAMKGVLPRYIARYFKKATEPIPKKEIDSKSSGPKPLTEMQLRQQIDEQFARLGKLGQFDYVVHSRPNKYYQKLAGKRYAPILDPVYEDLSALGRAAVLCETDKLDFECSNPPVCYDTSAQMKLRPHLPKRDHSAVIEQMEEVRRVVHDFEPEFDFEPKHVLFRYISHYLRKEFYVRLYRLLNPRVVFFSSFTSWAPIIWACRELGIPTVDLQHGGQSSFHGFNTHYSQVPLDGYWLLPDFFWSWGPKNRDIIRRWFPNGACRHIPLIGGNRWKAKWIGKSGYEMLSGEQRDFLVSLGMRKPVVLVTFSHGVDDLIPQCLLESMRRTPDWLWLLRLHPINRSEQTELSARRRLRENGLQNYDVTHSTDIPLHVLLQYVDYHLTPFSTAAREAIDFGVPTTIIDPIGKVDFAEDIQSGIFNYADTADEICERILKEISRPSLPREDASQLVTDDKYVTQFLEEVEAWRQRMLAKDKVDLNG